MMVRAVLLLAAAVAGSAAKDESSVTPVQKVIQLLTGMVEKGKKEKHDEQMQFSAYKQFCDDTSVEKQRAIKEGNEKIDMLTADIEEYSAEAEKLSKEIATHDEDISTWQGDFKAATKVRQIENTGYLATHKDYTESIQALEEAVVTMKKQAHDVKQSSAALMQLRKRVDGPSFKKITAFLAEDADLDDAPQANAYEFHGNAIIEMLEKLAVKFEDERTELEKAETNARNAFELLSEDLKMQIEAAQAARTEKAEAHAKAMEAAAQAKSDLSDTVSSRDDDTKYLTDLTATCAQKSAAFEERQQLRAEEITAVEKAIEILASGAVSGASEKHLPQLLQAKSGSLAQLRAQNPAQLTVAAYLNRQATKINSRVLAALAMRCSDDPFKKVQKMIKDLIYKLMEEANEEATHKSWCDTEMKTNEQTRTEKTHAVESLTAEIDELTAHIAKLTEEMSELTKAMAESDSAVAKATEIREAEKAKNTITIKDAQDAQTAVAQALGVLKEFYAKAAEATSLVQQAPPEIFDEPYRGMGAENGGVVGMIEVIQSDFARLESDTNAAELASAKEYDEFMQDSSVDKAQKTSDLTHKTTTRTNAKQALQEKRTDLDSTQVELDAAMQYFEKLKPSCMEAGESYADRVARRKEEIESLQEAVKILDGEAIR